MYSRSDLTVPIALGKVAPADTFDPEELSTDHWVEAAKSFGAKYIIFTIDHFSGFLMWPSETNYNYSVKYTKWRDGKGNVLLDFMKSNQKYGLEYGFFYSVHNNWYMGVDNYTTGDPLSQRRFQKVVEEQMHELFHANSLYRDPFYIWFDAGIVPDVSPNVGPIIRKLADNSLCDECPTFAGNQGLRWVGNENALAPLPHWYAVPKGKCSMKTNDGEYNHYLSTDGYNRHTVNRRLLFAVSRTSGGGKALPFDPNSLAARFCGSATCARDPR